jgi:hypothetical protein
MLEKRRPASSIRRRDLIRLLEAASTRRAGDAAARIFEAYAARRALHPAESSTLDFERSSK